jgi:hypothetical protein
MVADAVMRAVMKQVGEGITAHLLLLLLLLLLLTLKKAAAIHQPFGTGYV